MNQKTVLIGMKESDIDFVVSCLKDKNCIEKIIYWNSEYVAECLSFLKETDSTIVVCINEQIGFVSLFIDWLSTVLDIDNDRFINFYKIYYESIPYMNVSRVMENNEKNSRIDGIILGISHAEVGIIPELIKEKHFVNLAVSSQDIYYNYQTLNHCYKNYYEQIKNMEYMIIDMFDYTYFNYDVSLSTEIINYVYGGGIRLPHNYESNKNYNYKYDEILAAVDNKRFNGITEKMLDLWEVLFIDPHKLNKFKDYTTINSNIEERIKIVTQEDIASFKVEKPIVLKRFEHTIEENILCFDKLLNLARLINPDIKIYCVIIPRYIDTHLRFGNLLSEWKKEFYWVMTEMQKKIFL